MLILTISVDVPSGKAIAVDLEKYGDTRVLDIKEVKTTRQMEIWK